MSQKPREFWIEGNPFAPNLHCAATFEVPSTSACEIIHVIAKEDLKPLIDVLKKCVDHGYEYDFRLWAESFLEAWEGKG